MEMTVVITMVIAVFSSEAPLQLKIFCKTVCDSDYTNYMRYIQDSHRFQRASKC